MAKAEPRSGHFEVACQFPCGRIQMAFIPTGSDEATRATLLASAKAKAWRICPPETREGECLCPQEAKA